MDAAGVDDVYPDVKFDRFGDNPTAGHPYFVNSTGQTEKLIE
jgi:hypothetical protein